MKYLISLIVYMVLVGFSFVNDTSSSSVGQFYNAGVNATYYVRTDGGTSTQCNGKYDIAYPGTGTGLNCAFESPFWALGANGGTPIMVGGDALIIGPGEYEIGYGAPGAVGSGCSVSWTYDCFLGAIPSGVAGKPTRILGKGWDSGCSNNPVFWASGRAKRGLNLEASDWVEVQCLEITDKAQCGAGHIGTPFDESSSTSGGVVCQRNVYPQGPYGGDGLYAIDSDNVYLRDINIHGMGYSGIATSRLSNWRLIDVVSSYNSQAGWSGDIDVTTNNSGYIEWIGGEINWNGCIESITTPGTVLDRSCTGQGGGNYADGVGMNNTGGLWLFKDMEISHNVQDGLDLLYLLNTGRVIIDNLHLTGNGGNALKTGNTLDQNIIRDTTVIGNCSATHDSNIYMNIGGSATMCRAGGQPLAFAGNTLVERTTIYSNGSGVFLTTDRNSELAHVTFEDSIIHAGNGTDVGGGDGTIIFGSKVPLGYNEESGSNPSNWKFNNTIVFDPRAYLGLYVTYFVNDVETTVTDICQVSTSSDPSVSGCSDPVFTELMGGDIPAIWMDMPTLTIDPSSPYYTKAIGDYR